MRALALAAMAVAAACSKSSAPPDETTHAGKPTISIEEVRQAVRILKRFVMFNHELFQLVEDLQHWEKSENSHADTPLDRGEPSLRTA